MSTKEIGRRLMKLRESQGISMYSITKETGLRYEIIKYIESGDANYTIESLLKYAAAIHVEILLIHPQSSA